MIPIHISVRGVIFATTIVTLIVIFVIVNNSKEKEAYQVSTGTIEYLDKSYQELPNRHYGDYRYLKIDTYPYVFEIYEPNSEDTDRKIDNLSIGDIIDIYYYETPNTRDELLNRFCQFIDHDTKPYFIRNGFQKQLGYLIIVLALLMNGLSYLFWKRGKLAW